MKIRYDKTEDITLGKRLKRNKKVLKEQEKELDNINRLLSKEIKDCTEEIKQLEQRIKNNEKRIQENELGKSKLLAFINRKYQLPNFSDEGKDITPTKIKLDDHISQGDFLLYDKNGRVSFCMELKSTLIDLKGAIENARKDDPIQKCFRYVQDELDAKYQLLIVLPDVHDQDIYEEINGKKVLKKKCELRKILEEVEDGGIDWDEYKKFMKREDRPYRKTLKLPKEICFQPLEGYFLDFTRNEKNLKEKHRQILQHLKAQHPDMKKQKKEHPKMIISGCSKPVENDDDGA
jgi:hypothetical protein